MHEVLILALETLAILLVSLGLGVLAARWAGLAGLLLITGASLMLGAGLAAYQQRPPAGGKP